MAKFADVSDVEAQVHHWSSAVLQCRTYGHPWQPSTATYNPEYRTYYTIQICPRCRTERHAELNSRGAVFGSWYRYPEGYLSEDLGRIAGDARDVIRLAAVTTGFELRRLKGKAAKEATPHTKQGRESAQQDGLL